MYEEETNWIKEYIGSIRKDRVKWESKLYAADRLFKNKSMYEQVEEMMDIVSVHKIVFHRYFIAVSFDLFVFATIFILNEKNWIWSIQVRRRFCRMHQQID